ncbi:MAG: hypothetical protein RLZZ203_2448 [Cyanobacteriota bacterium]|jgi:hypothetical protein
MKGKNKEVVFICLSCISIGSLFGSFAGNLQRFEVWEQAEINNFNQQYKQVFIINENDNLPYGLDKNKAVKIASNYQSDIIQKSLLLGIAGISATVALLIANINFEELELNWEIGRIETTAKKQLMTEKIKNKYALMSVAQREQFRLEIASLLELTGGDETQEASEINATDKFINCSYLLSEGHDINIAIAQTWNVEPGTQEHTLKKLAFEDWLNGKEDSKYLD